MYRLRSPRASPFRITNPSAVLRPSTLASLTATLASLTMPRRWSSFRASRTIVLDQQAPRIVREVSHPCTNEVHGSTRHQFSFLSNIGSDTRCHSNSWYYTTVASAGGLMAGLEMQRLINGRQPFLLSNVFGPLWRSVDDTRRLDDTMTGFPTQPFISFRSTLFGSGVYSIFVLFFFIRPAFSALEDGSSIGHGRRGTPARDAAFRSNIPEPKPKASAIRGGLWHR